MRIYKALILSVLFLLLGCAPPGPPTSNGLPAAATPALVMLWAEVPAPVPGPAPQWVLSPFAFPGPFKIMPLRSSTSSNIKLVLDIPYPSTLNIVGTDPATGTVTTIPQVPSGQPGPSTAFFEVDNIDVNSVPARWTVHVRLPPMPFSAFTLSLTDVSGNPIFTGTSQTSAALVLPLVPSFANFTINVTITGMGRVTSNPNGIDCNQNSGVCSYYFATPPKQVDLNPGSSSGWKFSAWSGDCSGSACTLAQSGLNDSSVVATFVVDPLAGSVPSGTCGTQIHPAGATTGANITPICQGTSTRQCGNPTMSVGWICCDIAPIGQPLDPRCPGNDVSVGPPSCSGPGETMYADGCFSGP